MSGIRRKPRQLPDLNTAALPDLIFTVLFFFMIVTHMRTVPNKVVTRVPQGTQLAKLVRDRTTVYVQVGKAHHAGRTGLEDPVLVQVDDRFMALAEMADYIAQRRDMLPPDLQDQMTVSVRVDRDVPMGVVTDVKMALRKAGALKVHYAAAKRKNPLNETSVNIKQ